MWQRRGRWLAGLGVLAVTLGLAVVLVQGSGSGVGGKIVGEQAPPLAGASLQSEPLALHDLRGQVVLVNIWSSWCAPCRAEFPLLDATQRELGPHGLAVLGVNTQDTVADARDFLEEVGVSGIRNLHDPDGRLAVQLGARGIPETFLIDQRGVIVDRVIGEVTQEWIESTVRPLVVS